MAMKQAKAEAQREREAD